MFETKRLSPQYVLLDFLADYNVYNFHRPLDFSQIFTKENLTECEKFVNHFLDPLTEKYGPTSIAGGFWPEKVRKKGGHHEGSPHCWTKQHGTAADVVFHDWVNKDRPPLHLACEVDGSHTAYDRINSYLGSEFLCLCYRDNSNKRAFYENIRLPNGRIHMAPYGDTVEKRPWRQGSPFPDRSNWRRAEGQGVASNRFRAQHVRVGEYFVLLDFCRSVKGLQRGIRTVPNVTLRKWDFPEVHVSRMFSEVLDPIVRDFGRITVIRGIEPTGMSDDVDAPYHRWNASKSDCSRLVFLVQSDNRTMAIKDQLNQTPHVLCVNPDQHDDDSVKIAVMIKHFSPKVHWTSAKK